MLKQRVITAIILLAVLLGALLVPNPMPLVLLLTLIASCALWEWLRLTWPGPTSFAPLLLASLIGIGLAFTSVLWLSAHPPEWIWHWSLWGNRWLLPVVAVLWLAGATFLVLQGQAQKRRNGVFLSLFGLAAVLATWLALVQLFRVYGAWYLVSLLALIWIADIGAYFTGKAFGRHKLAPKVSPGKTWEGAAGGVVGATVWVMVCTALPGSFGAVLADRWPLWLVFLIAIFLASLSIIGDLFESLLKRRAGVKDSSQLLPGHGGVYDRIDALLPVAPLAFLLSTGFGVS